MSETAPVRLRLDSDAGRELKLALRELPSELPSDDALGALRLALSRQVGEPVRLRKGATESLKGALTPLASEAPSPEQLRALRARLPKTAPALPQGLPKTRNLKPKRRAAVTVLAWLLPAAAAAMSGAYWATHQERAVVAPSQSVEAPSSARPLPLPHVEPAPLPSASIEAPSAPSASASANKPAPVPNVGHADPEAELGLMREAQAALSSNPARALELVAQHAQRFPRGVLAQEREVVAIDALKRLGRNGEAQARAARFRKSHPESAYLPRIDRLVGAAPAVAPAESAKTRDHGF